MDGTIKLVGQLAIPHDVQGLKKRQGFCKGNKNTKSNTIFLGGRGKSIISALIIINCK
jgi:hypothetical protein